MLYTRFQQLLEQQINRGNVNSAAAGVWSVDGRIDFVGAAGLADSEAGRSMLPDTPYSLASITKMYTATVIINLAQRGQLNLDAPISQYLPATLIDGIHNFKGKQYGQQITVLHLLSQTSGLPDYFLDKPSGGSSLFELLSQGQDVAFTIDDVAAMSRNLPAKFEPGAANGRRAAYADTNFQFLGAIIREVTGRSIAENFAQWIIEPLSLPCTYLFGTRPVESATIYLGKSPVYLPKFFSSNNTDGGLMATVRDNLVFLKAFCEARLFDAHWLPKMTARWNNIFFPMQYGWGQMRVNLPAVIGWFYPMPELIGHSGSTGSYAYYSPNQGLYLAGTVNQIADPSRPIRLLMQMANLVRQHG